MISAKVEEERDPESLKILRAEPQEEGCGVRCIRAVDLGVSYGVE
jgi:hypothetical protein